MQEDVMRPARGVLTDFRSFVGAVCEHWFSGMCGVLSVVLTCASPFVDSVLAQRILVATAAVSYLAAAFAAWRRERARANGLTRQVASQGRLEIDFVPGRRGYEEERDTSNGTVLRTLSVRLTNVGGSPVGQVRAYAMAIDRTKVILRSPFRCLGLSRTSIPETSGSGR